MKNVRRRVPHPSVLIFNHIRDSGCNRNEATKTTCKDNASNPKSTTFLRCYYPPISSVCRKRVPCSTRVHIFFRALCACPFFGVFFAKWKSILRPFFLPPTQMLANRWSSSSGIACTRNIWSSAIVENMSELQPLWSRARQRYSTRCCSSV